MHSQVLFLTRDSFLEVIEHRDWAGNSYPADPQQSRFADLLAAGHKIIPNIYIYID
jgi:hypothetical protein